MLHKNEKLQVNYSWQKICFFALKLSTKTRTPRRFHWVKVSSIFSQNRPLPWSLLSYCMRRYTPFISFLFWDLPHRDASCWVNSRVDELWPAPCKNTELFLRQMHWQNCIPDTRWAECFHERRFSWATPIIKTIGLFRRGRRLIIADFWANDQVRNFRHSLKWHGVTTPSGSSKIRSFEYLLCVFIMLHNSTSLFHRAGHTLSARTFWNVPSDTTVGVLKQEANLPKWSTIPFSSSCNGQRKK